MLLCRVAASRCCCQRLPLQWRRRQQQHWSNRAPRERAKPDKIYNVLVCSDVFDQNRRHCDAAMTMTMEVWLDQCLANRVCLGVATMLPMMTNRDRSNSDRADSRVVVVGQNCNYVPKQILVRHNLNTCYSIYYGY